jgi:hypothetical protein
LGHGTWNLGLTIVITGFNTDIEHDGTVYHVQTEDKGLDSPLILSLVYAGGAILASKRVPYDDLIRSGFNERTLAERLQRQHKLICAAIRSGRIEDLKRMSQREPASRAGTAPAAHGEAAAAEPHTSQAQPPPSITAPAPERSKEKRTRSSRSAPPTVRAIMQDRLADFARAKAATLDALSLSLLNEGEFRGGDRVIVRIRVGQGEQGREAIADAEVTVKVLGSTFRPLVLPARTGPDGIAVVRAEIPHFKSGRAAILVRAVAKGYEAELRRIIQQG